MKAFLGYINGLHYVSTIQDQQSQSKIDLKCVKRKLSQNDKKGESILASKRESKKRKLLMKSERERKIRLGKVAEHNRQKRNQERRNVTVTQKQYLDEYDTLKYGAIHEQCWAQNNMKTFHSSLNYSNNQCIVCQEVWPVRTKPLSPDNYMCSHCTRDKKSPRKFSDENSMIPSSVPNELQGLTQTEEMLIARALPVMRVYIKPGGQRGYSGHCINLPQNVNELAYLLPRYPKDLSVIIVKVKGRADTCKDVIVRRQKGLNALLWLIQNNPQYADVEINCEAIDTLPENGIPFGLLTVDCENDIISDESYEPHLGPPSDHQNDDFIYNASTEMSSFLPVGKQQQQEIEAVRNQLSGNQPINWPPAGDEPLNEYDTPYLATMAFPTLFPDGKGDLTNPSLMRYLSLQEKIQHLLKFAEKKEGKWIYRFASHSRFPYWAFDMILRKRTLQQTGIFLKQNPGEAYLTIDELHEMAASETSAFLMSKISRYVANISGTNAYWHKVREDLKAIITTVGAPTFFFTFSSADMHWPELHALFTKTDENLSLCSEERRHNVINNPHIVNWIFTQRTKSFMKYWLYNTLDAKWHWYRFEYQARGSIHCHGTAKLNNDPGLCELTKTALKGFLAQKLI